MNTRTKLQLATVVLCAFSLGIANAPSEAAPAKPTVADPHDVVCAKEGTLWVCKHTLGADAGNVIVAVQDYANCPSTEDSCGTVYTVPPSGPHAGDGHLMVVGLGS